MEAIVDTYVYDSPVGKLTLEFSGRELIGIRFGGNRLKEINPPEYILDWITYLDEYFAGTRREFMTPAVTGGTPFQRRVWQALMQIPYGQTVSYSELADRIGSTRGCRAVASACHRNPLPIVIPCHRVVGKNGSLTGYAGGLNIKKFLLDLENFIK